jgi:nicotinamidase-related amidase
MLTKETTGLIVIDIQGKLASVVDNSELIISNSEKLIKGAQALKLPILWLEQNPEKLGRTTPHLCDVLSPLTPVSKFTFDACDEQVFLEKLQTANINTWLVCGIEAHICVYQTVISIANLGIDVEIVVDCVSSRAVFNKELALTKLASRGVGMTSLEMCLYELVGDCRTEEFKEILSLIK